MIRDVIKGIVRHRLNVAGSVPFNLMNSVRLVWFTRGFDYLEAMVWQEKRPVLIRARSTTECDISPLTTPIGGILCCPTSI